MSEAVVGKLAEALTAEAPLFCAWVGMNEPAVAEALAREAFDAVVLDMQHGALDFPGASRAILSVALAGKPTIVRAPVGEFSLASRLLDAGAAGIIAPMINSRDDARAARRLHQVPAARRALLGPARRAAAQRPRRARLSQRRQRDDPDDRDDRDPRGARRARRHSRGRGRRRRVRRAVRPVDRADRRPQAPTRAARR